MPRKSCRRFVEEQRRDEEVRPFIEQLLDGQNCSQAEEDSSQSDELNNSSDTESLQNEESGSSEAKKGRGLTTLKDIWNMPPGKTVDVQFNTRNQAIGKEGRKLASFLGVIARIPELVPLNIDDWRSFDKDAKNKLVDFVRKKFTIPTRGEEFVKKSLGKKWKDHKCDLRTKYMTKYKTKDALLKNRPNRIPWDQWVGLVSYWFSDKAKKRSQANKINRTKQTICHTGGSKSIATLMNEEAKDGIEPTRAEVFLLTHKPRKDGRPLDEESAKTVGMIQEKLNIGQTSNEQPIAGVAWEGDLYSQVLGSEKSGYIRGVGLGPTPSLLWGSKSSLGNETIQKLEQEINELKAKHDEDMNSMKEKQDLLLSEVSLMRQLLCKLVPAEATPQNFNGSSPRQVPDADSGHERAPQNFNGSSPAQVRDADSGHERAQEQFDSSDKLAGTETSVAVNFAVDYAMQVGDLKKQKASANRKRKSKGKKKKTP